MFIILKKKKRNIFTGAATQQETANFLTFLTFSVMTYLFTRNSRIIIIL